jgi:mannose-1-phosphate guanylyltransferase
VKAIILAGGKGTRGKPFTDFFPKAMIPLDGKPLIDYVVEYLSSSKLVDEIIIVSDFAGLGGQIKHYFEHNKNFSKIKFVQDSGKGTAGDLIHVIKYLKNTSPFLLWFVDNLSAINIKQMVKNFEEHNSLVCIATRTTRKEETGFAIVDNETIQEFREKPQVNLQMQECLGIYVVSPDILKIIQKKGKKKELNFSYDILQELAKKHRVSAFDIGKTPWIDVESPAIVERNKNLVRQIIQEMR